MYARVTVLEWKMGQKHEGMEEMETDLQASEASGYYRTQLAELTPLSDLYTTPPYREVYEVVVQE